MRVCLHMYYLYVPMCICFLCICIAILCIRSVCRKQASHLCKRSQQPASLSLVCLFVLVCARVCVCTQSIIHAIIDTKQERRSQPAWASLSTTTAATTTSPEMLLTQFKKLRKICSLFYAAAGNQL